MKRIVCLLCLLLPVSLFAQNLLMNGGFEDENICTEYEKNCAPEGWISTSLYADYYFDDEPHAFEGKHFTGLILVRKDRILLRNFLRTRLLCGLRKGAQYTLRFAVRSRHSGLDSVGVYFSAADFLYERDRLQAARPQLYLKADTALKRSNDWQQVSLLYTATGDESFLSIGDFNPRGHEYKNEVPDLDRNFYFFIDDVSLTPLNASEKLCDDASDTKAGEYAFDARHDKLDRMIYTYTKNPPALQPLPKTVLQRVDTLVIPDVLFATASFALNKNANALLDSFARRAAALRTDSVIVEGHTDNVGTIAANQKLSESRAAAVASFLQARFQKEVLSRGYASTKPVADNRTPVGRQKNRRVEIYLYVRE